MIDALLPVLRLFEEGKPINVKISIARPERTVPQLRYLHGVAYKLLSIAMGFEPDEISEYLCGCYWGWKPKRLPGGRAVEVPIRTTTVDEDGNRDVIEGRAFWDYVEWIQRVGARHGLVIPDPDPNYKIAAKPSEQQAA
ncbi:hypothetical protein ACFQZQ_03130 [Lysobacter koreensis]|uniref:Uncharacterized protein n=1 Tax=Lysobacter koreensis TaxID=266122 RepID=A0ABW2YMB6_9GAMM